MLKSTTTLLVLLALGLAACSSTSKEEVEVREPIQHPQYGLITAQPVEGWDVFGADVPDTQPIATEQLVANAAQYDGTNVVVEGEILSVCPKKGCWMRIDAGDEQLFVKFVDYAFFVPKDAAGKTARLDGWFQVEEMPVEEAKHYLEDAKKPEEAAKVTAPVKTYRLEARGVRIAE